jgi:hypothetical protein
VFVGLMRTMDSLLANSPGSAANAMEMLILVPPYLVAACEASTVIQIIRTASTMPNALQSRVVQSAEVNNLNS